MSNRKSSGTRGAGGRPAPGASLRRGGRLPVALLLAPLLLTLGLGGWRAVAASLPQSAASVPATAATGPAPPVQATAPAVAQAAANPSQAPGPSPAAPNASPHGQWVLAPDVLPAPAFPGDVPPLPVARSAQDPGFHPDLVLGTQTGGGTVTLTCLNPATNKTEVIVGRAGRDTVFALADPQAASLSTAPVQAVVAGALVASRDPATGATGYGRVTATVQRPAPALVTLSLLDPASGMAETLTCTPEHPLYVSGRGWVEAGDLGIGTSIVTRAGPPVVVKAVSWRRDETGRKPFTVYNLTVEGDHTYFAGTLEGGAWAHNACRDPLHHIFPLFRGNATYGGWFNRHGINPDAFTVSMNTPYLKWLHGTWIHGPQGGLWNQEWRSFMNAEVHLGRNYTQEEIWQQARNMIDKYGIPANYEPYR